MGKSQKQHYVPEVYLHNFSCDEYGNLYSIKIKPYRTNIKIKLVNKSQVCYKPDNYKFSGAYKGRNEFISDPNYIENNLFKYEDKFIKEITKQFEENKSINSRNADNLIRVLLSIKWRNLRFKAMFMGSTLVKAMMDKELEKIRNSTIRFQIQHPEKYEAFMTLLENEVMRHSADKSYMGDVFNDQLMNLEQGKDDVHEWLIQELSKAKFMVYCATDSNPFLTSDNPGYSVHDGDIIGDLFFGSAKAFAFPISKTRLFVIDPSDRDGNDLIIKKVRYIQTPYEFLKLVNKATIINSEERIFSNSRDYLENLMSVYDFKINKYCDEIEGMDN